MGIVYYVLRPQELQSILRWKLWHDPVHKRTPEKETETLRECYKYLDKTGRSFASVIQELNPELVVPVCLFYLVLRGLDTIEDDMTIPIAKKEGLLRSFDENLDVDGWSFTENGPNEPERDLLVHFDVVITELKKLKPQYLEIIKDVTIKMGNGMADYAVDAEFNANGVDKIVDYELYCHYVAGLVGEGLTRLFVESTLASQRLKEEPQLTESMGQFLQKNNIIRDVHEDYVEKRRFWPKEIWSKYVDTWDDLFKLENREIAIHCSSDMILNALKHVEDCLSYIGSIHDQSVFNFVAIPQCMAMATLELAFRNPAIFERNIKITKGSACQLMMESTQGMASVCNVFRRYVRRIGAKNDPSDPNFAGITARCMEIEIFIDTLHPAGDSRDGERAGSNWLLVIFCIAAILIGAVWIAGIETNGLGQVVEMGSRAILDTGVADTAVDHTKTTIPYREL